MLMVLKLTLGDVPSFETSLAMLMILILILGDVSNSKTYPLAMLVFLKLILWLC